MDILLIQPFNIDLLSFFYRISYKLALFPQLTLPMLAALTPDKHNAKIIDEGFQRIDFDYPCDIVGITCITATAPKAYEIADEFRRRGKTVILGGLHPTALPSEAKKHADSVVIGEAEFLWPKLLKDFEGGKLKPFYKNTKPVDPTQILIPKRELIMDIPTSGAIQATRGCPTCCRFCTINNIEGTSLRTRPVSEVIKELKSIGRKNITFYDASLTNDLE